MTIGHWPINQSFSKFTLGFGSGFPRLIHGLEKKLRRVCNLDCLITHKIRIFCIYKLAFSDFRHLIHFCDSQFSIIKRCFVIIPFSFSLNKDKEMSSETAVFNETLPFPSFHLKNCICFFPPKNEDEVDWDCPAKPIGGEVIKVIWKNHLIWTIQLMIMIAKMKTMMI